MIYQTNERQSRQSCRIERFTREAIDDPAVGYYDGRGVVIPPVPVWAVISP